MTIVLPELAAACRQSKATHFAEEDVRFAVYQNADLGHSRLGECVTLVIGPKRTFTAPPKVMPDSPKVGLGWRYRFKGWLNLETGQVEDDTSK